MWRRTMENGSHVILVVMIIHVMWLSREKINVGVPAGAYVHFRIRSTQNGECKNLLKS